MLSPVDEIKNRLDIVEVIGGYIKLQKAGINYRALCPFHSEKTPSFFVSSTRQIWHCFGGCSEGGDIFKFVMKIEGVEFGDALRILAQKAGVELKKQDPKIKSERQRLYGVCELTTKFFEKQLEQSKIGQSAKKYLLGRKISEDSLKKWRLGYAPDVWQGLSDFLNLRGYQKKEIEKAGLGLSSERGSFYDRFRGRIIFPIFDLNSQVVGFTGRVFKDKDKTEAAKYVNTPSTPLYDKSQILYGLDKAKIEIRKQDCCILVEGNTDVIMAHQAGFTNAVATSGTALTFGHLKILKRYSDNLLIAFDMDVAGETATKRGIDLAQSQGFNIRIIRLPWGKDPAEIIADNPGKWKEAVENAKSIYDFYFESAFIKFDKATSDGKREIAKILLPVIKRIPNRIVQSHWVGELAKKLSVNEKDVEEELKKIKLSVVSGVEMAEEKPAVAKNGWGAKSRRELIGERLVILILKFPSGAKMIQKNQLTFFSSQIREILNNLKIDSNFDLKKVTPETANLFNRLSLESEAEGDIEEKDIEPEIQYCLKEISSLEIKDKLGQISLDIKQAEQEKDLKRIEKLIKEFNQLVKEKC